jgi:hypothetical protein
VNINNQAESNSQFNATRKAKSKQILIATLISSLLLFSSACGLANPDSGTTTTFDKQPATSDSADTNNSSSSATENSNDSSGAGNDETANGEAGTFAGVDLKIQFGSATYTMLEDAAPLLAELGEAATYSEAESCVFEGMDKTFDYGYVLVYTVPSGDTDLLDGFDIIDIDPQGSSLTTTRGIGLGATRDELITAYGEPAEDDGAGYLTYNESGDITRIDQPRVTFVLDESDKINMISYYSGSNAQS